MDALKIPFGDAVLLMLLLLAIGFMVGRAWQSWIYEADCRWDVTEAGEEEVARPHLTLITRNGPDFGALNRADEWLFDWEAADPALRRGDRG